MFAVMFCPSNHGMEKLAYFIAPRNNSLAFYFRPVFACKVNSRYQEGATATRLNDFWANAHETGDLDIDSCHEILVQ